MYVHRVHTYAASAFSVNGTYQIMGPSKGSKQGVPISVARLYCVSLSVFVWIYNNKSQLFLKNIENFV